MMCSASRYLLIAFAVGSLTASFAGSEAVGWAAAVVAVLAFAARADHTTGIEVRR